MGRTRRITSPKKMLDLWEEYKQVCDSKTVVRTEFSQKESRFVTSEIPAPVSYTVLGFCLFLGMGRNSLDVTYRTDPRYADVIARIEDECERDVRDKFENRTLPTSLASLWMGKYGYSTKNEQNVKGAVPVVIGGADGLSD